MKSQEKSIARVYFKNRILESDGYEFEKLFTEIMNYKEANFQQIKPWGNIGDRKNDGYIRDKGIFYQVYAPENINNSYYDTIKKINTDFKGLLNHKQWNPIKEFYFVINDKYKGVNPDASALLDSLILEFGLDKGCILTPKDLENYCFNLEDDQIIQITKFIPPINNFIFEYSDLNCVINYIMGIGNTSRSERISMPDWNEKIKYNKLSDRTESFLRTASYYLGDLEEYLDTYSGLADSLQKKIMLIYDNNKEKFQHDELIWRMVEECSPKMELQYFNPVFVILAKYFECCDIFEEPK